MLILFFWLMLVFAGGWLGALSFTGRIRSVVTWAVAVPIGLVLYILFFCAVGGACSPWTVAGLVSVFGGAAILARRYIIGYRRPVTGLGAVRLTWVDGLAILLLFVFFVIHSLTFLGNDEINHFFFASQIVQGKFPPSAYGFPTAPVKYHYGWDILLASGILVSGLPHPVVSDALTVYSLLSVLPLAFCVLHYLGAPPMLRVLCGAGLFVGDGLAGALTWLMQGHYRRYLTLTNLYHQHPWTLALGLFSVSLVLVSYCVAATRVRDLLFPLSWLAILYLAVPVCSATMLPIAVIVLATIAWRGRYRGAGLRGILTRCVAVAAVGTLLFGVWPRVGGIMVSGDAYDRPVMNLAVSVLGFGDYLKYETAYVLMMPVAFWVFCYAIYRVAVTRLRIGSPDAIRTLLWLCVLLLIPCPMVAMVENSAYWDNFCKFNFLGVLAAWLLLPTVLGGFRHAGTAVRVAGTALLASSFLTAVLIIAGMSTEAFEHGPRELVSASNRRFVEAVAARPHLIDSINCAVDLRENILLVDSRVRAMFPVSQTTNRAAANQYGFFTEHFGEFKIVPQITGRSVLNFYDYNFFYDRAAEYRMADAVDRAFRGDSGALCRLKVSHILCSSDSMPDYLGDWEKEGRITLTAADVEERWCLYRVH